MNFQGLSNLTDAIMRTDFDQQEMFGQTPVQFSSLQNLLILNLFLVLCDVAWFFSLPLWEHRKLIMGQFPDVDSWHKTLVIISFYLPPVLKGEQIPTPLVLGKVTNRIDRLQLS